MNGCVMNQEFDDPDDPLQVLREQRDQQHLCVVRLVTRVEQQVPMRELSELRAVEQHLFCRKRYLKIILLLSIHRDCVKCRQLEFGAASSWHHIL